MNKFVMENAVCMLLGAAIFGAIAYSRPIGDTTKLPVFIRRIYSNPLLAAVIGGLLFCVMKSLYDSGGEGSTTNLFAADHLDGQNLLPHNFWKD